MSLLKNNLTSEKKTYVALAFNVVGIAFTCLLNIFITPYITEKISIEAYGFVSLNKNFMMFANLFLLVLNTYAARFLTLSYLDEDNSQFSKYYNTLFFSNFAIGIAFLVIGTALIYNIDNYITISNDIIRTIQGLFFFSLISLFFSCFSTLFTSFGYIKDRLDELNMLKTIGIFIEIISLVFMFYIWKPNVIFISLSTLFSTFFVMISGYYKTKKYIKNTKLSLTSFSWTALIQLIGSGIWNALNSLGNILNSGLDLYIANRLITELAMGQIAIAKSISQLLFSLFAVVSQPFHSKLLNDYSKNNKSELIYHLTISIFLSGMITNVIVICFYYCGELFIKLWIPSQDIKMVFVLTLIAMIPCLPEGWIYPTYYVYTLTLKNTFPCAVTIIGGVLNVLSMIFLMDVVVQKSFLILGTTAVIMCFINLITNPLYVSKCLNIRPTYIYLVILTNAVGLISNFFLCNVADGLFMVNSNWLGLICKVTLLFLLGIIANVVIILAAKKILKKTINQVI